MELSSEHVELPDLELLLSDSGLRTREQNERITAIQEHLSSCAECAMAADMHKELVQAKQGGQLSANRACPPEHVWYELAGGLLPTEEAARWLAHEAECSDCGVMLREAREDLDGSTIEAATVDLRSSTAAWQNDLARRLSAESKPEDVRKPEKPGTLVRFPSRRTWMSAIAAMLLLTLGWTGWKRYQATSDDALLAQAYDLQRRTELRLPGGDAVPLASMNRGSSEPSLPTPLLRLNLRAQEHLDRDENNPYWHVVLGRIALVENNGERAKQELETALALNSGTGGVKADLAAAYFEIGEGTGDQSAFARAADLYGQILDHPAETPSPEALAALYFNRALCWDRQSIYYEAIQDYQQALKLEHDHGWRQEIERRLNADRTTQDKSESAPEAAIDRSPDAFLHPANTRFAGDDEYELYLLKATSDWLPHAGSTVETDAALRALAALGITHHDSWLAEMLPFANSRSSRAAAEHLSRAVDANARGSADVAVSESAQAAQLFLAAGNKAGRLRAEVERSYSLARQGRAKECLVIADPLLQSHALEPYVWLHVYLLLNRATCSGASGDVEQFTQNSAEGMRLARQASLPLHMLRAEGFLVEGSNALGDTPTAWKLAQDGLRGCASHRGTRTPTYQFLESIYSAVKDSMPYTAAAVAEAATHAARLLSNLQLQAYAFELQGRAETAIAHQAQAGRSFQEASTLLQSVPQGRAAKLYQADWEADRAEWLAQSGHVAEAIHRLSDADEAVAATDNYAVRQVHHSEFAKLLLLSGDVSGALLHATSATRDAERALATTKGETERLAWERTNSRGYRLLVEAVASRREASGALRAWEWYRAAPYRRSGSVVAARSQNDDLAQLPQLPPERLGTLTLVVGRLESEYIVWFVDNSPSHLVRLVHVPGSPQQIEEIARTLTELCADRHSSEQSIRAMGRELYEQLFGQLWPQLEKGGAVQLDLDRSLQDLPVASLVQHDGRYFGLAHTLVLLPAWWSVQLPAQETLTPSPQVLVVEGKIAGPAGRDGSRALLAEQYLETRYLQTVFPAAYLLPSSQANTAELKRRLPKVELFHYSGHTTPTARQSALLLGASGDTFDAKAIDTLSLHNLRLAVLATCSSTGGLEAGVNDTGSITHALLRAGAANVIATLWDVDTRSFRDLMEQFYRKLLDNHPKITEALRFAQQAVQENIATAHPFYWASTQLFAQ